MGWVTDWHWLLVLDFKKLGITAQSFRSLFKAPPTPPTPLKKHVYIFTAFVFQDLEES